MKPFSDILRAAGISAAGLFLLLALAGCGDRPGGETSAAPSVYQCPMHPWITSKEPARCTICGMDLVPETPGESGGGAGGVALGADSIRLSGISTGPVVRGPLARTLRLAGTIEDDAGRHRVVASHFDGRIERPFIEQVGEEVRAGAPLAEIYSPELLNAVREHLASKRGGDRVSLEASSARLVQFGLQPDQIAGLSADHPGIAILSPITGTVIKRYVNSGQYVKTGEPLFELGDFSVMWLIATAYESDLPHLHLGQKAKVTTPASPGQEHEGTITLIDPNFDPATRSTKVRIEIPNPPLRSPRGERRALPHGAFAEARILSEQGEGLLVPRSAVLDTGSRAVAFVEVGEGNYAPRDVIVDGRGDAMLRIASGLSEGERVVTAGSLLLDAEHQIRTGGPASVTGHDHGGGGAVTSPAGETPSEPGPFDPFLAAVADASAALAADDLDRFRSAVAAIPSDLPPLPESPSEPLRAAFAKTGAARGIDPGPPDLGAARAAFHPLAEAAADLALALRAESRGGRGVGVFICPMTADAFPGAPAKARWVQPRGGARNPWFGAAMAECGVELRGEGGK